MREDAAVCRKTPHRGRARSFGVCVCAELDASKKDVPLNLIRDQDDIC